MAVMIIHASMPSNETANVRFYNVTRRDVDVLWINFSGAMQRYATLPQGASADVNTFVNHVWVFRDSITETLYLANGQALFYVTPTTHPCPYFRQLVRITYPLLSLKEIADNATRRRLPMILPNRPILKVSYESTEEVAVIFMNMTNIDVNIIWLEPDGHQVLYWLVAKKHRTLYARTMVGHVWFAESTFGGNRLLIDGKQSYVAEKCTTDQSPLLEIKAPLYSLAELARMRLRHTVYLSKTPVKLDLPITLLQDLDRGIMSYQIH